ncbi:MAG: chorismate-binding protein [Proteobacteria bacterium]|nr:chorismate-binding protein [Pseudomonadota bacterium]
MSAFALLDDNRAGRARLYTALSHVHTCADAAGLEACWARVAADQQRGLHAVLLADYEWGVALAGLPTAAPGALRVLMFGQLTHLALGAIDAWLAAQDAGAAGPTPAGALGLNASVDEAQFMAAIAAIHEAIRDGATYQINYTYRLSGQAHGMPAALYRRLRARQPVAYGAFIALPGGSHVLSLSPELFLRHAEGVLTARPMKGTAARGGVLEADSETARGLHFDDKNRAENLMIVDLLRNDLGRVARVGGVRVPELFAVEPYRTVFQMTSTIEADLRPGVGMPELLRALFPCGSITGAPKHETMKRIAALETTPRGLYCGAIGWVDAPAAGARYSSVGDFCLSVAIRTLTLAAPDAQGARALRLGIGAGITIASDAGDEYAECQLKARFLTGLDPGLGLIETLRVQDGVAPLQARHRARMAASAQALGLPFDAARFDAVLAAAAPPAGTHRVRLLLEAAGGLTAQAAPLPELPPGPLRLVWAEAPLAPTPLSAHKTTQRAHHDAAIRAAEAQGAFDTLYLNAAGDLVEGARSSVLVRVDGQWLTPRVADGALPGVMRAELLARGWPGSGEPVREAHLPRACWQQADAWAVCNALRGVRLATF